MGSSVTGTVAVTVTVNDRVAELVAVDAQAPELGQPLEHLREGNPHVVVPEREFRDRPSVSMVTGVPDQAVARPR